MRLAFVIDSLAPGGAERSLVDLLAPLASRGLEVAVIVRKGGGALEPAARDAGAAVLDLGGGDGAGGPGRMATAGALAGILRAYPPTVVHTATVDASIAGRVASWSAGVAVTTTLTGTPYGPDHRHGPPSRAARVRVVQGLDAATARLAWRFHAPAEHVAATMTRRLALPPERVEVIWRGRDLGALGRRSAPRRQSVRAALGVEEGHQLVVALARHEHVKGLDVLAEAVPRLLAARPDVRVVVAGRPGGATPQLEGRLELLGHRDDVGDLLAAADVVVVPSRREGLPGVIVEAMALGTPVVASDLPGCREALGDDLGVLVAPGDPAALADALDRVLRDPGCAGDPAVARARAHERFGIDRVADAMIAFWGRALAAGPPRSPRPPRGVSR